MDKERMVRFVGGPLDGESREVKDGRHRYVIPASAAGALKDAMREEGTPAPPPDPRDLTYVRRRDGRCWLSVNAPDGVADPPKGFTAEWFDAGDDFLLLELHAPESDWGHAIGETRASLEFLSDSEASDEGHFVFNMAIEIIEERERKVVRKMDAGVLREMAGWVLDAKPKSKTQGNRRIIAAAIGEFADRKRPA